MGAGILPISFNGISLLFLLGQERTGQWSDFGGSSDNRYESKFKTGVREGYEELSGLLGNEYELAMLIKKNFIAEVGDERYSTFAFKSKYDPMLPVYFNRNYNFVKNTTPSIVNIHHNGLYEKRKIKWFTSKEIYNLELRPFYKNIIFKILENEKKIEKHFETDFYSQIPSDYAV